MIKPDKKLKARGGDMDARVKPLVWRETNDGNRRKGECFSTRSPVSFAPIAAYKKHDGWWLNVDCKTYPSLDAAKAAAQADYEARILAALEPAPDMAELVEAHRENARVLSNLHNDLQGRVDAVKLAALFDCLVRSTAALAKIKEPQT